MNYNPEVYLVAAEMIENFEYSWLDELQTERGPIIEWCCPAIKEACKQIYWDYADQRMAVSKHTALFEKIFKPELWEQKEQGSRSFTVWWLAHDQFSRLTALTLAAAIVSPNNTTT